MGAKLKRLFGVSPWMRHLPGGKIIELDTGNVYECLCSPWRYRCQLVTESLADLWLSFRPAATPKGGVER